MSAPLSPAPLSDAEIEERRKRIMRITLDLGFVERIEYQHVYSQTGGAPYGFARTADDDLLTVYAEAFNRDANPNDFSLEAILAHERGHQLLVRHPRIAKRVAGRISPTSEKVLASILGAMIIRRDADRTALLEKALVELIIRGEPASAATQRIKDLWNLLEMFL